MHRTFIVSLLALLFISQARAQDISTARFMGALDGAADACAEAFPKRAHVYRAALRQATQCRLNGEKFEPWLARQLSKKADADEFRLGKSEGSRSLSRDAKTRIEQCRSLEYIPCSRDR